MCVCVCVIMLAIIHSGFCIKSKYAYATLNGEPCQLKNKVCSLNMIIKFAIIHLIIDKNQFSNKNVIFVKTNIKVLVAKNNIIII